MNVNVEIAEGAAQELQAVELVAAVPAKPGRVRSLLTSGRQRGMVTAEYAVGACAAAGFAGILLKVLTDDGVFAMIMKVIAWLFGLITGQKIL